MSSQLLTIVFVAVGLVLVSVIVLLYILALPRHEVRSLKRAWGEIARQTRLRFTPPKKDNLEEAQLHGVYRNREVAAAVRMRTAFGFGRVGQKEIHYYTRLEAYARNPDLSVFRLNTIGAYRQTDQFLGQPLRPIGDHAFDSRYDIKCIPPDLAMRLIPPHKHLRDAFLALKKDRYVEFELSHNAVRLEEEGTDGDARYLLSLFNLLCDFADTFERL